MDYISTAMTEHVLSSTVHATAIELPGVIQECVAQAGGLVDDLLLFLQQDAGVLKEYSVLCDRLDAHLDLLRIAGGAGARQIDKALASPSPGVIFLACISAVESKNTTRLRQLLSLVETQRILEPALQAALAWINPELTQALPQPLLSASSPFYWRVALHLLHQHQTHADTVFEWSLTQPDRNLQYIALQAAGDIGMMDLLPRCLSLLQSADGEIRYFAARACTLLGECSQALCALKEIAVTPSPRQQAALSLLAVFLPINETRPFLTQLAKQGCDSRLLIQLVGELGDPSNVPALLRLMQNPVLSRIAAHAFCTITGLGLIEHNMDRPPPNDAQRGPNDDPDDDNVESDPDENLPWPDQDKVARWWAQNDNRFQPGVRYLAGGIVNRQQCLLILQDGSQAQRRSAALHMKALDPASPLFLLNTPVWRQQKRLSTYQK